MILKKDTKGSVIVKITVLVENTTHCPMDTVHGLALYIETQRHKILFDLGPDHTLFANSVRQKVDIAAVDTVIISHGHNDHGGALTQFLQVNHRAKVYVQATAFAPHYSLHGTEKVEIGLDPALAKHPQVELVSGDLTIDEELHLFTAATGKLCHSPTNDTLYNQDGLDDFCHEQHLLIGGKERVLMMGCGHQGVVNILEKARAFGPTVAVGGFHLYSPGQKKTAPTQLLDEVAAHLKSYPDLQFYTCHCTGPVAFQHLKDSGVNIRYCSCGEVISL